MWLSPPRRVERVVERVTVANRLELLYCNKVSGHIGTILRSPGHIQRRRRLVLRLDLSFFFFFFLSPFFFAVFARNPGPSLSFSIERDELSGLRSVPHANSSVIGSWKITRHAGTRAEKGPAGRARNAHKNVRVVAGRHIATSRWALARSWNSMGAALLHRSDTETSGCTRYSLPMRHRPRFDFSESAKAGRRSRKVNGATPSPSRNSPCHFHFGHISPFAVESNSRQLRATRWWWCSTNGKPDCTLDTHEKSVDRRHMCVLVVIGSSSIYTHELLSSSRQF